MDIWIYGFQIPISEGIKLPSTDKLYPCRQGKNIPKAEAHHLSAGKRKPYIPIKSYPPLWKKKKKNHSDLAASRQRKFKGCKQTARLFLKQGH